MDDLIGSCSDENGSVDLGILLKKCYETAFYMPPSPSALSRSPLIGKPGGSVYFGCTQRVGPPQISHMSPASHKEQIHPDQNLA